MAGPKKTWEQLMEIARIINESGADRDQVQRLIESPYLEILFMANTEQMNEKEFRLACGLGLTQIILRHPRFLEEGFEQEYRVHEVNFRASFSEVEKILVGTNEKIHLATLDELRWLVASDAPLSRPAGLWGHCVRGTAMRNTYLHNYGSFGPHEVFQSGSWWVAVETKSP